MLVRSNMICEFLRNGSTVSNVTCNWQGVFGVTISRPYSLPMFSDDLLHCKERTRDQNSCRDRARSLFILKATFLATF